MKYSNELVKEITKHLEAGATAKDACDLVGISEETFYAWKKEKPEFSESVKKGKLTFKASLISAITVAGKKDWRASAWLLEHRFPKEFSLKHIEITDYQEASNRDLTTKEMSEVDRLVFELESKFNAQRMSEEDIAKTEKILGKKTENHIIRPGVKPPIIVARGI